MRFVFYQFCSNKIINSQIIGILKSRNYIIVNDHKPMINYFFK